MRQRKKIQSFKDLVSELRACERVFVQPHNFPDHDAVASAYGLAELLKILGVQAKIVYEGEIQRDSLKHFIEHLKIDIRNVHEYSLTEADTNIVVDGCKGNQNVTDLPGHEIAVIDHHHVKGPNDVDFVDIRDSYGACSTLIAEYYSDMNVAIPKDVATALMIGINVDTANLTRGVSDHDLEAYTQCFRTADVDYVNSVLRNFIKIPDLSFYQRLLKNIEYYDAAAFCCFFEGCSQNLLGILGDFILALEEIDFVVLCAVNKDRINFSVRSERHDWDASVIIKRALTGRGFGGGHADMAGGVIVDSAKFDWNEIRGAFLSELNITEKEA